jgi:benzoylformate decarboxylase
MKNQITGRSAFLALLKDEGVSHLFGNPGTTELPVMDALSEHPDMEYVMAMQESIVVYMADGFSRASGKLTACNVHVAPGLGNAMGAIYTAKFSGTPIIITAGQQEQGHGLMEPLLYDPLVPIAEPLVKWAVEVTRLEDLPRIVHRAAKIATTPPTGPVFISLPGDILNMEDAIELGSRTRVDAATRPSDSALKRLATRLLAAENPVIIAGTEIATSHAFAEAAAFAETLGAPVYQQTVPHGAHFPSEHPAFVGGLGREQPQVRKILADHDLLVVLGADVLRMSVWSEVDALPDDMKIVHIAQRDWELGKNYPTEIAVRADVRETLAVLTPILADMASSSQTARAAERLAAVTANNWTEKRAALIEGLQDRSAEMPIYSSYLMHRIVENLPVDAVVVDEGILSTKDLHALLPFRDPQGFFGLPSGGIGWGLPAAIGIQMALPDRPVTAIIGDGSAMYSIQALWTAAHKKLPITYVIPNNGGYRIIRQRLKAFHGNENFVGMKFENPPVNYSELAQSLGVPARAVTDPAEIDTALQEAYDRDGPSLIEVFVERGPE